MDELTYRKHMNRPWDNYIMRKHGGSIRRKITEATLGSASRAAIVAMKIKRTELAQGTLELIKHKAEGGTFN